MNYRALLALCLGFFMVIMDATIINVALPTISNQLHASVSWLQWIVAGYTLSFACLLITAGHLGDQFGEKKIFLSGVLFFVLFSLSCGLVDSPLMLTIFRLLQGLSAAFIVPASLAILHALYDNPQQRAKAMGIWGAVGGVAAAIGPVLGGFLTSWLSWRAVFFVNVPIGLICFFMTCQFVKIAIHKKVSSFDLFGQLFVIIFIASLAFALIEAGRLGWHASLVHISFIIAALSLILFIISECKVASPMIPLAVFKNKNYSIGNIIGFILNVAFYGELFILPLYFERVLHYSVVQTGLALIPLVSIMVVSSYFSGQLSSKIGMKIPMLIGLIVGTVGFVWLNIIIHHSTNYLYYILPLILMGYGISFAMPSSTLCVMQSISANKKGIAAGAYNTARQIGSLVGVALFGTFIATQKIFINGMSLTLMISATLYFIGFLLVLMLVKKNE